jgi:hypothetical protein
MRVIRGRLQRRTDISGNASAGEANLTDKYQKIEDVFDLLTIYGYRIVASDGVRYKDTDFRDYLCIEE